jgi:hypothetical protein
MLLLECGFELFLFVGDGEVVAFEDDAACCGEFVEGCVSCGEVVGVEFGFGFGLVVGVVVAGSESVSVCGDGVLLARGLVSVGIVGVGGGCC